jgi:hypothetical protein
MKLGEAIYKAEQESAKEEPKKEAGTGDNADVVDADYEEVEKGK